MGFESLSGSSMNDIDYMRLALEEARVALQNDLLPVGAIVVQGGQVIGKGVKNESHSYHLDHGEIIALRAALKNKSYSREDGLCLYTTLEPCIMCYGTILHCPISRVVYAADDAWGGATKILEFPQRHQGKVPEVVGGVLALESRELIEQFLRTTDQPFYSNKEGVFYKSFISD